ncbi:hypothetical protein B0O99DRAFT_287489 [Bisporella sp. PMI_857]|nr:hypothetical protein B0O99DRAFT_287489 [Bisporella sp. PMI_857]
MAPVENSPIPSAPSNQGNVTGSSFPCTQCDKAFNRRENLSRHLKTHQTTKTHQCSICGKEFTRSDLCKRHEAIHKASPAQIQGQNQVRKEDTGRKRKRGSVIAQSPLEDSTSRSEHPSVNLEEPYFISGINLPGGATSGVDTLWRHVADIPLDFSSLNSPSGSGLDAGKSILELRENTLV